MLTSEVSVNVDVLVNLESEGVFVLTSGLQSWLAGDEGWD